LGDLVALTADDAGKAISAERLNPNVLTADHADHADKTGDRCMPGELLLFTQQIPGTRPQRFLGF
jgi:hypothetical protein